MAVTTAYSGNYSLSLLLQATLSGDKEGSERAGVSYTATFAAAGGTAPTLSGFLKGTVTLSSSSGDILLAHATDPFQSFGDSGYSEGFTVAGSKLKWLSLKNTDASNSITIARAASNGLPIFDTAGDSVTLAPGDVFTLYKPAGTAALTTGSNDALTVSRSGGTPTLEVVAGYGP